MPQRSQPNASPEVLRESLVGLLTNFSDQLKTTDLRAKVLALVPVYRALRNLGSSLIPRSEASGARDRIIAYLKRYPLKVIDGDVVVSGIGEWARRVRELRVQFGWWIYSGVTFADIVADQPDEAAGLEQLLGVDPTAIKPDQYVLMRADQDLHAAHRWNVLNEIRKKKTSVKDKMIEYLRTNVGEPITGEELKYLAGDKKEWARRVRELRTEDGWPILTKNSGRQDLPVGVYVLEEDRQAKEHDRRIPDAVRVAVLQRDGFKCVECGWSRQMLSPEDPRKMLELHHKQHHEHGGPNSVDNLVTLCNVHHDAIHAREQRSTYGEESLPRLGEDQVR